MRSIRHHDTTGMPPTMGGAAHFWKNLRPPEGFNKFTARFHDRRIESDYQQHLVLNELPKERVISYLWTLVYVLYGILDILVISDDLGKILVARWLICTPIALGLASLTFIDRFKPYFGYIHSLGVFAFAISIIWMIGVLPAEGAPPYIIGVLMVFIYTACILRIPFLAATTTFVATAIVYAGTLLMGAKFAQVDIISGLFFMVSAVMLAIATNYTQEIRSRIIWRQSFLREQDAKKIENLLIEATAADQSKINFLSMMSHELRTPLHQIIGYAELVTNKQEVANENNENTTHLNEIHNSAQTLLARIQKMLRYADTNAGKIKYDPCDNDIKELVDASLEQTRVMIEKKHIKIDTSALGQATITIDIFHSCYALNNIIENAVNASGEGETLLIYGTAVDDGGYELTIEDRGVGIAPEQVETALKPFTQGENVLKRSSEGLGLGLTLAQKIFNDQGAVIALESELSVGTKVRIRFPAPSRPSRNLKSTGQAPGE